MNNKENLVEELRVSEERLKMVLEGSQQGFWDWNIQTGEVVRNDRWAQILGYDSIDEFENTPETWTNLIHPDDREMAWNSINDHLEGRTESHKMEYRMRSKSGEYHWILDHAKVVLRDENGKALRMCGTHIDITDRKVLEAERDELIESLKKALNEIKTLRGILPLCAYCKKIRDDEGYWEQVEIYIRKHSEADVSHGICPDCVKKHFPNVVKND